MALLNDKLPPDTELRRFTFEEVSRLVNGILDVTDPQSSIQKKNQLPKAPIFVDLNFNNRRRKGEKAQ